MARRILARIIVAILLGVLVGVAVGNTINEQAQKGRDLTLKEYVDNFETHKQELTSNTAPMAVSVVIGILLIIGVVGFYELLVLGVERGIAALDRRKTSVAQPGTPPPW